MIRVKSETIQWDKVTGTTEYDILINGVKKSSTKTALQSQFALTDGDVVRVVAQPSGEWQEITFDYSVEVDTPPPPPPPLTKSYENAIAGTMENDVSQLKPNVAVTSKNELLNAIAAMVPGQHIYAKSPFVISDTELIISKQLLGRGELTLEGVTFEKSPVSSHLHNIFIRSIKNIYIYFNGAEVRYADHAGISIASGDSFGLYDFDCHDNGGDGVDVFPAYTPISNYEIRGKLQNNGLKISDDPHSEQGTGIHASNNADCKYDLLNGKHQFDIYDQPTGAGFELGQPTSTLAMRNIGIWLRAKKLGRAIPGTTWGGYGKSQGSGNVFQPWGPGIFDRVKVHHLEADQCMGCAVAGTLTSKNCDIVVEYGRATNMLLAPVHPSGTDIWMPHAGIDYVDVK